MPKVSPTQSQQQRPQTPHPKEHEHLHITVDNFWGRSGHAGKKDPEQISVQCASLSANQVVAAMGGSSNDKKGVRSAARVAEAWRTHEEIR